MSQDAVVDEKSVTTDERVWFIAKPDVTGIVTGWPQRLPEVRGRDRR